jgi:hypothetical protein
VNNIKFVNIFDVLWYKWLNVCSNKINPHQIVRFICPMKFLSKEEITDLDTCSEIYRRRILISVEGVYVLLRQIGVRVWVLVNRLVKGNATDIQSSLLDRIVSWHCETSPGFLNHEYVASNVDCLLLSVWRISNRISVIRLYICVYCIYIFFNK